MNETEQQYLSMITAVFLVQDIWVYTGHETIEEHIPLKFLDKGLVTIKKILKDETVTRKMPTFERSR